MSTTLKGNHIIWEPAIYKLTSELKKKKKHYLSKPDLPTYRVPVICLTNYLYLPSNIQVQVAHFKDRRKEGREGEYLILHTHIWVHFIFKFYVKNSMEVFNFNLG